ncbi:hypothetical protein A3649_07550 [Mycobacterium ulcerans]|nr:hypothetical protein A3649_07550 [Mycobacterium ulcerans]
MWNNGLAVQIRRRIGELAERVFPIDFSTFGVIFRGNGQGLVTAACWYEGSVGAPKSVPLQR